VTAAAFASDALACGALLEAQSRGIGVPQRLALLGCGDDAVARHMAPALSTVALPCDDVGRQAANALLAALRGEAPGNTALAWQLIPRGST
jgi:DNA-binding LacI/PurR family transcriptional regulator